MRGKEAPAGWRGKGRRSSCRVALRASEEEVEFLLSQREVPVGRLPRGDSRGGPVELPREESHWGGCLREAVAVGRWSCLGEKMRLPAAW